MTFINVADLKDLNDPEGRTYREINNATKHKFKIGDLVELDNGVRLYVVFLSRDCDRTPLYSLGWKDEYGDGYITCIRGLCGQDLELVGKGGK